MGFIYIGFNGFEWDLMGLNLDAGSLGNFIWLLPQIRKRPGG
jgi:hypothetical protein